LSGEAPSGWLEWLEGRAEGAGRVASAVEQRARLKPDEKVADLGAGTGLLTLMAAKSVGAKGLVYAVDSDPACMERLSLEAGDLGLLNIRSILSDIRDVPLEDGELDAVLARSALIYTSDVGACAREIARLIGCSGRFSVCEPLPGELTWWGGDAPLVGELNDVEQALAKNRASVSPGRDDLRRAFGGANLEFSSLVVTYRLDFTGSEPAAVERDYLYDMPGDLSLSSTLRFAGSYDDDYVVALAGRLAGAACLGEVKASLPCIYLWGSGRES
jgi:SAM-dependent methyltransferase